LVLPRLAARYRAAPWLMSPSHRQPQRIGQHALLGGLGPVDFGLNPAAMLRDLVRIAWRTGAWHNRAAMRNIQPEEPL
jgi:hypothetical protein